MAIKLDTRKGGAGLLFYLFIVFGIFALASGIIAWQTLDDCGGVNHSWHEWRVFPPGWECPSPY